MDLYHYTSAHGLEGIIKNQMIWSTYHTFLNDYKELRYAYDCFKESLNYFEEKVFKELEKRQPNNISFYREKFQEFLYSLNGNFEKVGVFVSSFTTERDSLTHWLSYSGQYCIVLDENAIEYNNIRLKNSVQHLQNIEYGYGIGESNLIVDLIDLLFKLSPRSFSSQDEANEAVGRIMYDMFIEVILYFSLIKHEKFKDEKEKRLITLFPEELTVNGAEKKSYFTDEDYEDVDIEYLDKVVNYKISSKGLFVPFIEIYLPKETIKEIIIGPALDSFNAEIGLKTLVGKYGINPIISMSNCPFRHA